MQIPLINGIYVDAVADFRASYPRNLVPVAMEQGISKGYLKQPDGLVNLGASPGIGRGGINWNGTCYRVFGSKFCIVQANGVIPIIGDVGDDGNDVTMVYSFDRLAIASNGNLFYFYKGSLFQVTDENLGSVIDVTWIDGYFVTTDGESLVCTTLADPTVINPLSYGSSESDPDPIKNVMRVRNQLVAINRYTIEFFQDIGGNLFPFQRIDGAEIMRGSVGTHTACQFVNDSIVFLGSGRDEPPAIWLGLNGLTTKLSTKEVEKVLKTYTEGQLSQCVVERRTELDHDFIYLHLPDKTYVFDYNATKQVQEPVWSTRDSALGPVPTIYRCRHLTWCYDQWIFDDPTSFIVGTFTDDNSDHYGSPVTWEFGTIIIYNKTNGAEFHELELVGLTGFVKQGANPTIWTSYSTDGRTWSNERPRSAAKIGDRNARLNWVQLGNMLTFRIQKFRSSSDACIAIAALEARIEALNV